MDGWQEWDTPAKRLKGSREARELTQTQLAKAAGVSQSDVSKLERGDSLSTSRWPQLARALGVDGYWLTTGEGEPHLPHPGGYDHIRPPTIGEAVHALAEALVNLDETGRRIAESTLAGLAKDPAGAERVAGVLQLLVSSPPPSPPPSGPTTPAVGGKESAKQRAANRPSGKAQLVLKLGGGDKRQLSLPLKTVRNPFDSAAAPANERAWYERVKAAPKANSN